MRGRVLTVALSLFAGLGACALPTPDFGRPCEDDDACDGDARCEEGACVPADFPGEGEGEPPTGETCGEAVPLGFNTLHTLTLVGMFDDVNTACGSNFNGVDAVFSIEMPADHDLRVLVDASFHVYAYATVGCDDVPLTGTCAADVLGDLDVRYSDPPDGTLFIVVEGFDAGDTGPFSVRVVVEPL